MKYTNVTYVVLLLFFVEFYCDFVTVYCVRHYAE